MKTRKYLPLCLLAGLASSTVALAGTPGINGLFSGSYQLTMRSLVPFNMIQGQSGSHAWSFLISNGAGWAYIVDGSVTSTAAPHPVFNYKTNRIGFPNNKFLPVTDNGDGTYTIDYHFEVDFPVPSGITPEANTSATFDITLEADGSLTIITLDADSDGVVGVGLPSPPFPVVAEPDLHGTASPM